MMKSLSILKLLAHMLIVMMRILEHPQLQLQNLYLERMTGTGVNQSL